MRRFFGSYFRAFFISLAILILGSTVTYGANVSISWDENVPAPEGYRVFIREKGDAYDYNRPDWESSSTICTLSGLTEGITYHFVVRAFDGGLESADSVEVTYTPSGAGGSPGIDSDGDQVPDILDRFPNDPTEWADNDNDNIGDNSDPDDDNDQMDDAWEIQYGLDPLTDDADLDPDSDGLTNLEEYMANTPPTVNPDNQVPDAPVVDEPVDAQRVELTPVLVAGGYFDDDNDAHYQSEWQISTESDFSTLVLVKTSTIQLTACTVGELVLDVDTTYYWRVRFVDDRLGISGWSETATFTTIDADESDDLDQNGIPDHLEISGTVDVNEDGTPDLLEDDIMTVHSVEGETIVGVETVSDHATVVSVNALSTTGLEDQSIQTGFGIIGFKLYLEDGETTATVRMHFSKEVDSSAQVYKYITESGWEIFENAVFSEDYKSVTLVLEDGGVGDEDGVKNGVIIDPSGISAVEPSTTGSADSTDAGGGGGGGCFISATGSQLDAGAQSSPIFSLLLTLILVAAAVSTGIQVAVRLKENR